MLKLTLLSSRVRPGVSTGLILRYCSFFFILYLKRNFYRKLCHLCLNIWRQKKDASETKLRGKQVTAQFFLADFFARLMQLLLVIKISASGHFSLGLHVRGPVFVPGRGGGEGGRQLDFNPLRKSHGNFLIRRIFLLLFSLQVLENIKN